MKTKLCAGDCRSDLVRRLEEITGENLMKCYQCGKCSAGCPNVGEMELLPNQIIRLAQLGAIDELLASKAIWFCASCFTCYARCPKGVDLSKVMEGLRALLLRPKGADRVDVKQRPEGLADGEEIPPVALIASQRKKTA